MPGSSTLDHEVTNISRHGFWLWLDGQERLLAFEQFPWFKQATIEQLIDIERPGPNHLYWPQLDVDLSVQSILDPQAFPLVSRAC